MFSSQWKEAARAGILCKHSTILSLAGTSDLAGIHESCVCNGMKFAGIRSTGLGLRVDVARGFGTIYWGCIFWRGGSLGGFLRCVGNTLRLCMHGNTLRSCMHGNTLRSCMHGNTLRSCMHGNTLCTTRYQKGIQQFAPREKVPHAEVYKANGSALPTLPMRRGRNKHAWVNTHGIATHEKHLKLITYSSLLPLKEDDIAAII